MQGRISAAASGRRAVSSAGRSAVRSRRSSFRVSSVRASGRWIVSVYGRESLVGITSVHSVAVDGFGIVSNGNGTSQRLGSVKQRIGGRRGTI